MAEIGRTIAGEIRRHRLGQGLSAQQLSDRCAELGAPIPRTVLSNFENGKRQNITVAEVLVLARALGVPPGVLIFPVGHVAEFEVLPGAWQEPLAALDWLSGTVAFSQDEARAVIDSPLGLLREHDELIKQCQRALEDEQHAFMRMLEERERAAGSEAQTVELEEKLHTLQGLKHELSKKSPLAIQEDAHRIAEEEMRLRANIDAARTRAAVVRAAEQRAHKRAVVFADVKNRVLSLRQAIRDRGLNPPPLPASLNHLELNEKHTGGEERALPVVPVTSRPDSSVSQLRRRRTEIERESPRDTQEGGEREGSEPTEDEYRKWFAAEMEKASDELAKVFAREFAKEMRHRLPLSWRLSEDEGREE
ncbi:helix-turn-helix transcriptional regulator [Streptomyces sp. CC219B]|uniref:helix-turn-helix domain-containing protein n=1 Tax=Streptomyces sp. CC219B TaxID=3044574 RepID=UPI0024A87D97|nr:helix-turn-helix transcriptional regulator [Streptomyces sp. CC219B]